MPILSVEVVGIFPKNAGLPSQDLADLAANILGSPPGQTWVKLYSLPIENYAENNISPSAEGPVFISIIMKNELSEVTKGEIALSLAREFGKYLNRPPEKIHTYFEQEGRGRIAFGGNLIT